MEMVMAWIQGVCLRVFIPVYCLVHHPLSAYIIILVAVCGLAWWNFRWIRSFRRRRSFGVRLFKTVLIGLEAVILAFLVWYLVIHFRTYKLLSLEPSNHNVCQVRT